MSQTESADALAVGTLIDLEEEDESATDNAAKPVIEEMNVLESEIVDSDEVKLCGYLNKLGSKGLIKTYKTRWFVYDPRRCQLYYYRMPTDLVPLGSIEIANASFTFDIENNEKPTQFEIHIEDRVYYLQAKDRQTMMFWLQELQERRRKYSLKKTSLSRELCKDNSSVLQPSAGLVSQENKQKTRDNLSGLPKVMTPTSLPLESVGEKTANSMPNSGIFNFSLTNLRIELRNQMSHFSRSKDQIRSPDLPSPTSPSSSSGFSESPKTKIRSSGITATLKRKISGNRLSDTCIGSSSCNKCDQFQGQVNSLKEDIEVLEEELQTSQAIIKELHKQLTASQVEKNASVQFQACQTDKDKLILLQRRNKQMIQLDQLLRELTEDRDRISNQARMYEDEMNQLKEQMAMYSDMIQAKDETVVALTNQIFELEKGGLTTPGDTEENPLKERSPSTSSALQALEQKQQITKLKDAVEAFRTQNKFLNKEILELNQLRKNDMEREQMHIEKYTELEAEFYRVQSKYFILLNDMKAPKKERTSTEIGSDDSDTLISQLLEEAINTDISTSVAVKSRRQSREPCYDRYGFSPRIETVNEEEVLISKATDLQRRSDEIAAKLGDLEISIGVKWENYFVNLAHRELFRSNELKMLIRAGIPHEYRTKIWLGCVNLLVKKTRDFCGPDYYKSLLKPTIYQRKYNPAAKQIELDLLRTLPYNKHYENMDSDGIPKLRNILLAYTSHNPYIGYCQGLNRLVAVALLYLEEEDAFWCLVAIVERLMPKDYYSKTLIGSQTDQRVFKDLLSEKIPKLNTHLDNFNVDLSLITFNWFLTVFCDDIPFTVMLRIWDTFLYEGNKVLFRFALAFFKCNEDKLLQLNDHMTIYKFLQRVTARVDDIRKLVQVAFYDLNPFPRRHIKARRDYHLAQVKAELEELNAIRQDYMSSKAGRSEEEDVFSDEEN